MVCDEVEELGWGRSAMAWARICSVRGSLARRSPLSLISATRITQALGGCDQSATNTGVDDGHQCGVPWKRCASGVGGGRMA